MHSLTVHALLDLRLWLHASLPYIASSPEEDTLAHVRPCWPSSTEPQEGPRYQRTTTWHACALTHKAGAGQAYIIGLAGMGGIGKTTLATALYNRMLPAFSEAYCFLEDVRGHMALHAAASWTCNACCWSAYAAPA